MKGGTNSLICFSSSTDVQIKRYPILRYFRTERFFAHLFLTNSYVE